MAKIHRPDDSNRKLTTRSRRHGSAHI